MPKKGLVFLQNKKPKGGDSFLYMAFWRFVPEFNTYHVDDDGVSRKRTVTTFIELEIYENSTCVVSFYNEGFGSDETKYKVRSQLGVGHVKAILRACLLAFKDIEDKNGPHAFIFTGSDDEGEHKEDNKRYSLYKLFIDHNWHRPYEQYVHTGSIQLNTFILLPLDHPNQNACIRFFVDYEMRVADELENLEEQGDK